VEHVSHETSVSSTAKRAIENFKREGDIGRTRESEIEDRLE